ncbi:hypothetical protein [Stenomitos frigidus]|uniref:hypothetical protein n=1 Tax=Stenomitos frigidus TaxID=1886765 RepID=UPI0011B24926|nr:hypothetical protein [Stenomitos frigidus]
MPDIRQRERSNAYVADADHYKHSLILSESAIDRIINRRFPKRSRNNKYKLQVTGKRDVAETSHQLLLLLLLR